MNPAFLVHSPLCAHPAQGSPAASVHSGSVIATLAPPGGAGGAVQCLKLPTVPVLSPTEQLIGRVGPCSELLRPAALGAEGATLYHKRGLLVLTTFAVIVFDGTGGQNFATPDVLLRTPLEMQNSLIFNRA